ncbi:hypothetical protein SBA6_730015 [Candidatus Sulfopaludibacter sp. SbA6]|nr:hypothetical protein SBA6_730015 [Candidatus Sulfopaludibacter sp. SbA6]
MDSQQERDVLKEIAAHLRALRETADVIKEDLEQAVRILKSIDEKRR